MSPADKREEYVGLQFGKLTIIGFVQKKSGPKIIWVPECKCECGKTSQPRLDKLRYGDTISCGCVRKDKMRKKYFQRLDSRRKEDMTDYDWGRP